jgi:hypothetical protein
LCCTGLKISGWLANAGNFFAAAIANMNTTNSNDPLTVLLKEKETNLISLIRPLITEKYHQKKNTCLKIIAMLGPHYDSTSNVCLGAVKVS